MSPIKRRNARLTEQRLPDSPETDFPVEDEPRRPKKRPKTKNRPLVFVPGIEGSQLKIVRSGAKPGASSVVWPPMTTGSSDDRLSDFERAVNEADGKPGSPELIPYGLVQNFFGYAQLLSRLWECGFYPDDNLFVAAYNWTQSNRISGQELATNIPVFLDDFNRRHKSNHKSVQLICHSMGGLVTRSAIANSGAGALISQAAYIATPHYGSPKAYFTIHPDIQLIDTLSDFLIGRAWQWFIKDAGDVDNVFKFFKRLGAKMQSTYELMPDHGFDHKQAFLQLGTGILGTREIKTIDESYFDGSWRIPDSLQGRVRDALEFKRQLGDKVRGDHRLIYSRTTETVDLVTYSPVFKSFATPSASTQNGDGTVPTLSGRCEEAGAIMSPGEHVEIASTAFTFEALDAYLHLRAP